MDLEWNSQRKPVGNRSYQSENRVHRNVSASDFRRPPRTSWICWISLGQLNSRRPRLKRVRFLGEVEMNERPSRPVRCNSEMSDFCTYNDWFSRPSPLRGVRHGRYCTPCGLQDFR